jgi:hypothetical protein
MPFENSHLQSVPDLRFEVLKNKTNVDKDNGVYELMTFPPTGSTMGSFNVPTVGSIPCWNSDGSLKYIDIECPSDAKPFMAGLAVKITFRFGETRPNRTTLQAWNLDTTHGTRVGGVTTAIPWNPLTIFRTTALKVNKNLTPVEQYINDNQYGHITTLKFLRQFSSQALEAADDVFFTPCLEEFLDTSVALNNSSGLSAATSSRSQRWCLPNGMTQSDANDINVVTCSKMIPFSLLFDSCNAPAIWTNVNRFRWEFTMKTPDMIPLPNIHSTGVVPYVFITDIQLMYDGTHASLSLSQEISSDKKEGEVESLSYLYSEIFPLPYTAGASLQLTKQRNIQFCALAFPAGGHILTVGGVDWYLINPYQYYNNRIQTLNASYGNLTAIKTPIQLVGYDINSPAQNIQLYNLYKKCCARENIKQLTPAIPYFKLNQYHVYWLPFFSMQCAAHVTNDSRDIRIMTNGGINDPMAFICTTKLEVVQVFPNGEVSTLSKL